MMTAEMLQRKNLVAALESACEETRAELTPADRRWFDKLVASLIADNPNWLVEEFRNMIAGAIAGLTHCN